MKTVLNGYEPRKRNHPLSSIEMLCGRIGVYEQNKPKQ